MTSIANRRKTPRRSRQHSAWINFEDDIKSVDCRVCNISQDGAQLVADVDASIGSKIYLSTVPHSLSRRPCKIVWRRSRTIGVQFL